MQEVKDAVRAFVLKNYLAGEVPENLTDDLRLISSGILDSLAVLEVASFVQARFGVEFSALETLPEFFDRIDDIATLVARKRAA